MRLAFMGAPDFALPTLRALLDAGHEIAAVYSQPPRKAGRGQSLRPTPVAAFAEARDLTLRAPKSLRDADAIAALRALGADALVVVAYGLLLPRAALEASRLGAFNLHPSLLPRWRGAAPIQRAILAGDAETGVAVMRMSEGLDEGPLLAVERTPILPHDTAASLHDRLAEQGAALMVRALEDIAAGRAAATPQAEHGATYAAKIDKAEARIDWRRPAAEIDRLIRGLSPFPGAWFELEGERVKALNCALAPAPSGAADAAPGRTLDDALLIRCGDAGAALRLTRLQRAGAGAVDAAEFLRGRAVSAGCDLK